MSGLDCADSHDSARELLMSQSEQPGGRTAFPPFSEKLNVDYALKFSHVDFKQAIGDFFKDKHITPLSQLTATPPFLTPHVLAEFASKT